MKKLTSYLLLLSEIVVLLSLSKNLVSNLKAKNKLKNLEVRKNKLIGKQNDLKEQLKETQNDNFLEYVAREKLNLVKDNETLVIINKGNTKNENDSQTNHPNLKNWQKWRRVILGW